MFWVSLERQSSKLSNGVSYRKIRTVSQELRPEMYHSVSDSRVARVYYVILPYLEIIPVFNVQVYGFWVLTSFSCSASSFANV